MDEAHPRRQGEFRLALAKGGRLARFDRPGAAEPRAFGRLGQDLHSKCFQHLEVEREKRRRR